jgi:hypothetical protein
MDRDFPGKSIGAEAKTPVSDLARFLNIFMRQLCPKLIKLDLFFGEVQVFIKMDTLTLVGTISGDGCGHLCSLKVCQA